ncbi:MAG: GntR family transcriptional regulator [Pelosinus sp.]|nr:GntR family transcriptional regulator [Pelosinus sp.]
MSRQNDPKYLALMNWLKSQIAHGDFCVGDRLPSENELGEMFSISRQTVRQATSVLENEGLLERKRGSGTYVSSVTSFSGNVTMNIGVITTYLDDYIFPSIIKGIDNVLTKNGYTMQLSITYNKVENEMKILSTMLKNGVDGIIIEPTKSGLPNLNADLFTQIKKSGIPCIFINGYYQDMPFPYVAMDDYACGKEAARYLMQRNHTKIAGIFKSDDIQGHLRYAGCARMLKKKEIYIHDDNVIWYTTEDINLFSAEEFEARLLKRIAGCSAVICYNDEIAIRIIKVLEDKQRNIPADLSLISFDNSDLGTTSPIGLTTFSHPKAELGKVAATNLLRLINKEKFEATVKFKPELIVRDSVQVI